MPSSPSQKSSGQSSPSAAAAANPYTQLAPTSSAAQSAAAATSAAATTQVKSKRRGVDPDQILNESAIRYNDYLLDYCQTAVSATSGSAAGILGLTGLNGFVFYFICSFILSVSILFYLGQNNTKKFFLSKKTIFTSTLWSGIQTYLLFWTFLYGMVHVY